MHTFISALLTAAVTLLIVGDTSNPQDKQKKHVNVGYSDTPKIPGQKWRVHDLARPRPKIVTPGTASTQDRAGIPPSDAIVLFDGKNLDSWTGRNNKASWLVKGDFMECNKTGTIRTRQSFGDCQLHIEFQCPNPPKGDSQGRGNSGVYLMGKYEVQVLDSYDNVTYADGQAGALYGQTPPLVNACRKPGTWQMYDIIFNAPRFTDDGKLKSAAYVTVLLNGVLLHHRRALIGATTHRKVGAYRAHGPKGPIHLQDHGNPMRFRNIWVRELEGYDSQ